MAETVVRAHNLIKSFAASVVLDGLELYVERGQAVGLLGPNGAGKTTALRVLLGLLKPDKDSGPVTLLGVNPWHEAVTLHKRLSYVPAEVALWPNLTGHQVLELMSKLRGGISQERTAELAEQFDFDPAQRVRAYSAADRQKIALIAAFASDAELLILDEPTFGLDPLLQAVFMVNLIQAKSEGRTILLASHVLAEVEQLCDTITIIHAGRTVDSGTITQMRHLTRSTVRLEATSDPSRLATLPGVHDFTCQGNSAVFNVDTDRIGPVVCNASGLGLTSLVCQPPSLEDLFMRHYSELDDDGTIHPLADAVREVEQFGCGGPGQGPCGPGELPSQADLLGAGPSGPTGAGLTETGLTGASLTGTGLTGSSLSGQGLTFPGGCR